MGRTGRLGRFDATFTQAALKIFVGGPWVVRESPGARNLVLRTCRGHLHDACGSLPLFPDQSIGVQRMRVRSKRLGHRLVLRPFVCESSPAATHNDLSGTSRSNAHHVSPRSRCKRCKKSHALGGLPSYRSSASYEADVRATPAAATRAATTTDTDDGLPSNQQHTHDRESETHDKIVSSHRPIHRSRKPPSTITREGVRCASRGPITSYPRFPRTHRFLQRRARK